MPPENPVTPAQRRRRLQGLLAVALTVFLLDQGSKYWLIHVLDVPAHAPMHLTRYFALLMAWNTGVSFSMFAHSAPWMPQALTAAALLVSALLVRLCLHSPHRFARLGYALVIGGALGNAFDRLRFGAVADFFYFHIGTLGWPAFNVADMAIVGGVGLLLFSTLKHPARP